MTPRSKEHSILSPSGAERWISCPGSVKMLRDHPAPDNAMADEGSQAHAYAALMLEGNRVDIANEEMLGHLQDYVDYCRNLITDGAAFLVEEPLSMEMWVPGMRGTADFLCATEDKIHVVDLKYGFTPVDPEWNVQMMCYGLGALARFGALDTVVLHVYQPRISEYASKSWETSREVLTQWALSVLIPGAARTTLEDAPLNPGAYCRHCSPQCPEIGTSISSCRVSDCSAMAIGDVAEKLRLAGIIAKWAKQAEAWLAEQAKAGQKVPGMKLVRQGKHRQWADRDAAETAMTEAFGDAAFTRNLITPAAAEKQLKSRGALLDESLVYKPQGDLVLAPESDRRKEVDVTFGMLMEDLI